MACVVLILVDIVILEVRTEQTSTLFLYPLVQHQFHSDSY